MGDICQVCLVNPARMQVEHDNGTITDYCYDEKCVVTAFIEIKDEAGL